MPSSDGTRLGDRMKGYERIVRPVLPPGLPYVIRVDGRSFSRYLRKAGKPFDMAFVEQMGQVALALCEEISGAVCAYHQSDEVSVLVEDANPKAQPWFGGVIQKIASVSAGIATATLGALRPGRPVFDGRVFALPNTLEAGHYLTWRQHDAMRNSVTMAANYYFPHRQLEGLSTLQRLDILASDVAVFWEDFPQACRAGQVAVRRPEQRETTYIDRRTETEQTTTVTEAPWRVEPAEPFALEPGGYLASITSPTPVRAPEPAHDPA